MQVENHREGEAAKNRRDEDKSVQARDERVLITAPLPHST